MAFKMRDLTVRLTEEEQGRLKISVTDHGRLKTMVNIYKQHDEDEWRIALAHDLINKRPSELREDLRELIKNLSTDDILRIVYGENFEIVQTPEEKLRQRYETLRNNKHLAHQSQASGIFETLEILGIKVEGINDFKPSDLLGDDNNAPYCAI